MELGDKKFAVLIDADNVSANYIEAILDEVSNHGVPTIKRIYGDWTQPSLGKWKPVLLNYSIIPVQQYQYTSGKNSTDSALIIDAMDILYEQNIDGFCIVSSDSDFTRLASRLREAGKSVIGMGEKKTPTPFVNACEQFKYLEVLAASEKSEQEQQKEKDEEKAQQSGGSVTPSRQTLSRAMAAIIEDVSDGDGWAALGAVGQRINARYPAFDSRNYGFKKLSLLADSFPRFEVQSRTLPNQHEAQTFIRITDPTDRFNRGGRPARTGRGPARKAGDQGQANGQSQHGGAQSRARNQGQQNRARNGRQNDAQRPAQIEETAAEPALAEEAVTAQVQETENLQDVPAAGQESAQTEPSDVLETEETSSDEAQTGTGMQTQELSSQDGEPQAGEQKKGSKSTFRHNKPEREDASAMTAAAQETAAAASASAQQSAKEAPEGAQEVPESAEPSSRKGRKPARKKAPEDEKTASPDTGSAEGTAAAKESEDAGSAQEEQAQTSKKPQKPARRTKASKDGKAAAATEETPDEPEKYAAPAEPVSKEAAAPARRGRGKAPKGAKSESDAPAASENSALSETRRVLSATMQKALRWEPESMEEAAAGAIEQAACRIKIAMRSASRAEHANASDETKKTKKAAAVSAKAAPKSRRKTAGK